jgi:hypothetical protein
MDGSFTTQKPLPNDLDIVFFIPEAFKVRHFRNLVQMSEPFDKLHVFWIGLLPEDTLLRIAINQLELARWQDQLGTDRMDIPKGFLRMNGQAYGDYE